MKITVFGASGKVGRQVVEHLLSDQHEVTIFVHRRNPFGDIKNLRIVSGDISDAKAVKVAVKGSDVVISTLGSWHTKTKSVLNDAMQNIIPAMTEQGTKRIITLTGAGAFWSVDKPTIFDKINHSMLGLTAPKILRDGERHLDQLTDSGLDWTCIRSPIMTKSNSSNYRYTLKLPSPLALIPRKAVVRALLEQITNTDYIRQAPVIRKS